jgi:hypothetical protein
VLPPAPRLVITARSPRRITPGTARFDIALRERFTRAGARSFDLIAHFGHLHRENLPRKRQLRNPAHREG